MKIAFVNDFFYPEVIGGTELFLYELSKFLRNFGVEIVTINASSMKKNPPHRSYKLNTSPISYKHLKQVPGITTPWVINAGRKKIRKIYEKERFDLIYLNNIYHLSFAFFKRMGPPIILDIHDYWPICFSKDKFKDNKKSCQKKEGVGCSFCLLKKTGFLLYPLFFPNLGIESFVKKKLIKNVDAIISHSEFVKRLLMENDIYSDIIPYPFFGEIKNRKDKKYDEIFRILFVGRLSKTKGIDIIPKLAKVLDRHIDFRIDVIGDGPLKKIFEKDIPHVHYHGFLGEKRFEFFSKADCLLSPSRWPEPFGMVALEAMAYQLPVITLKGSGGLEEMVKKHNIGIVSQENQLVKSVLKLTDNELMTLFRRNCTKGIKNYKKEVIFNKYLKLFESLTQTI